MKTNVWLLDQEGKRFDLVVGGDNPVIPVVGDEIELGLALGKVKSRVFAYKGTEVEPVLDVVLRVHIAGEPATNIAVTWS